jgi:hypothetical protein
MNVVRTLLSVAFGLWTGTAQAVFVTGVDPKSAALSVLDGSDNYLSIDYFAWGPGWSGVSRRAVVKGSGDIASFSIRNRIKQNTVDFVVDGDWRKSAESTIAFSAKLRAEKRSEIVMSQFGLTPGPAFSGGNLTFRDASNGSKTVPLPVKRGPLGDAIEQIVLTDSTGRSTTINFAGPVRITADKQQLRMILARSSIDHGETPALRFELTLPEETSFVPDVRSAAANATATDKDWYEFKIPDRIPDDSVWQMRDWLEKPAGKHGRILAQGDKLIYNGAPIKLWGITNTYDNCAPDAALADKRADFYSALGINAVRLHKFADGPGWQGILAKGSHAEFDRSDLDRMDYFIGALKKQGIYVNLSPVFIVGIGPNDRKRVPYMDEFGPMKNHRIDPRHGSFYISTELQDLQIEQVVNLLNHRNPYTGLRYADDPAIAYVEMYNEDSALFGGVGSVMAKSATLRERTGRRFANWLEAKYKTEDAFLEAWGPKALNSNVITNSKLPTDESWRAKRIYPAGNPWFFDPTNLDGSQKHIKRRMLDTMRFLYELQNEVYARYKEAIRATGYSGELIASNWQAGRMMSHFYNLHSDALIGTIDRHNYFGGGKKGSIAARLNPPSMLDEPGSGMLSASMQQVDGRPFMLSEWIHVDNNPYAVEGPAIIGAYGLGLQGWDAAFAFQNGDDGTFSDGSEKKRWDATAASFAGILPAVSRQIHRQDLEEEKEVHYRRVNIRSLNFGYVGLRDYMIQNGDEKEFQSNDFPAQLLARKRTVVAFSTTEEAISQAAYFGASDKKIVTPQGNLMWLGRHDGIAGLITIKSTQTKAIIGDAGGKSIRLDEISLKPTNQFAAIYLTNRTGEDTPTSGDSFLLTLIGRSAPGRRGNTAPPLIEAVSVEIRFHRSPSAILVQPLDTSGMPIGRQNRYVGEASIRIDSANFKSPFFEIIVFD